MSIVTKSNYELVLGFKYWHQNKRLKKTIYISDKYFETKQINKR